jgi:SAM-dependent methyltransferase
MRMDLSFDRIADRYDETRGYPEEVMDRIVEAVVDALGSGGPVLDTGVGTGRFARPLQMRGLDVVGIDLSPKMLGIAVRKGIEGLVRGTACSLPFRDKSFESALSVHVMHLIPDWRCALAEIARVTRQDLVSIAFDWTGSEAQAIKDSYDEACERLGWRIRHPGVRERELSGLLPPSRQDEIARHVHTVDVGKILGEYETRTYSAQWDVPDDIHTKALEALRKRYELVPSVLSEERILLLVWDVDSLVDFATPGD